jgi:hypothetical protein
LFATLEVAGRRIIATHPKVATVSESVPNGVIAVFPDRSFSVKPFVWTRKKSTGGG